MRKLLILAAACAPLALVSLALAHGYEGDRFFPPTMTTDDPFAVDELALPTVTYFPGDDGEHVTDFSFEFDKEILPHFALGVSDGYTIVRGHGVDDSGWDNLTLTAKYELWHSPKHEAIFSIGVEAEVGGTGKSTLNDSFTTYTPTAYFGKGFGDLPESMNAFKPFALTGTIGQDLPTEGTDHSLEWGFALEYSLPYLQQHVKDVGLPAPFKDMIPLVEFSMETGESGEDKGITTGTINPGVLWETQYFQLGVEALIPVNSETGPHVGCMVQMWIYIDDLMPRVFGHPVFGGD